jgi:thioredoxin reductase (NADPH)
MPYDIIIIGGGPAGASAGILAARAKKKVLILDSDKSGTKKAWVANHYAVMGITGYDVFETGKKQAAKAGAEVIQTEAAAVEKRDGSFHVTTGEGVFEGALVLIATGSFKELANGLGLRTQPGIEPGASRVIEVDGQGRTSEPGIWAAGVCTGQSMHVSVTAGDGARVAINILSDMHGKRYVDHDMMC